MGQGIGFTSQVPIENGGVPVYIQDQTTPPFAGYVLQTLSTFTLSSPTQKSTLTTLYYTAELTAGHGVVAGNQILITDTDAGTNAFAIVISVATNTITIDRPWDAAFPVTSICRVVSNNLAVNGATTKQIFGVQVGSIPADIWAIKLSIVCSDPTAPDDGLFGNISALTNGLCFRLYDGYSKNIGVMKTNGELLRFACTESPYSDKAPSGNYGVNILLTLKDMWGFVARLSDLSQFQVIVQDDLTGLDSVIITFMGQYTQGETT